MSISSALNAALSGLNATSRQAEVISNNVANASTAGYARRSVSLSALNLGGQGQGVRVVGIVRQTDQGLLNDRRVAEASYNASAVRAESYARIEALIGNSSAAGSLSGRLNALDAALLDAASNPESGPRLQAAVDSARAITTQLNTASKGVQKERLQAEIAIDNAVDFINKTLQQIEDINNNIAAYRGAKRDSAALEDQRQQLIDQISTYIPVREMPRDGGRVALISTAGAILLDGKAATLGFDAVHTIVPEMTLASGALSGLTLNGQPMPTSGAGNLLVGGELMALFQLRDELVPQAQAQLDAVARDLIERFQDPSLDTTLNAGDLGLFTDRNMTFDPLLESGLAERITLNASVDPAQGGSVTRLRDGLGATSLGPVGNSTLLTALSDRLNTSRNVASAAVSGSFTAFGLTASVASRVAGARLSAESEQSYNLARATALIDIEAAAGVDVDAEMQFLLVVEQNWAANAKVISAVDEMMRILLGL